MVGRSRKDYMFFKATNEQLKALVRSIYPDVGLFAVQPGMLAIDVREVQIWRARGGYHFPHPLTHKKRKLGGTAAEYLERVNIDYDL